MCTIRQQGGQRCSAQMQGVLRKLTVFLEDLSHLSKSACHAWGFGHGAVQQHGELCERPRIAHQLVLHETEMLVLGTACPDGLHLVAAVDAPGAILLQHSPPIMQVNAQERVPITEKVDDDVARPSVGAFQTHFVPPGICRPWNGGAVLAREYMKHLCYKEHAVSR